MRRTGAFTRDRFPRRSSRALVLVLGMSAAFPPGLTAQESSGRLRDRGPGIPTSMFGTYVEAGEFLFYPFFEFYRDGDAEYSPSELGYGLDQDFRGKYQASEGLIFISYGFSDRLAVELEAAVISARLDKDPEDPTDMPERIEESGLGDVEGQIRWRWAKETDSRPGIFSYFETVFPFQKKKKLIGTQDFEFKLGTGVVRGFSFGTLTARVAVGYDKAEGVGELGEYAVEYLRRLSPAWRLFAAVEGSEDEIELITEAQWFLRPNVFLKLNNSVGITSKATGWAPEIGVMWSFK